MASIRELTRRATKLHAALQQRRGGGAGGVFVTLPNETPEALLARAAAAGRSGGLLVVPGTMDADEWERQAVAQQRALMVETSDYVKSLPTRPTFTVQR